MANLKAVQSCIDNPLPDLGKHQMVAGIIGDRPSQYAKSPKLWNLVMDELGMPARYVAFDVPDEKGLGDLVAALRGTPDYVGGNVTVPYKVSVMQHLDGLDEKARQIGAVNTIARDADGRLIGYNTDGRGAVDSILRPQPGNNGGPFVEGLEGAHVVLFGAGGAARAVAFYVAEGIGARGRLLLVNRSEKKGAELAASVNEAYGNCESIQLTNVEAALADAAVLINATVCGQSGLRRLPDGSVTCMEPYSPLAAADPAAIPAEATSNEGELYARWFSRSHADIAENQARSRELLAGPTRARVFDIVYSPFETELLREARLSGRATINGKGMNVAQAADGFFNRVFARYLDERGEKSDATYTRIVERMSEAW